MPRSLWKRSIAQLAARAGYEIRATLPYTADRSHQPILPSATFSPWNMDPEFARVFEIIRDQTLVDKYRCFDLWSLVEQVRHLPGDLLEVGVWKGGTGTLIARRANLAGTDSHIYLCDTFKGVVKASARDSAYRGGEHADASAAEVKTLLARAGVDPARVTILEGIFPDETAHRIPSGAFRFCHVDVDVYEGAKQTTEWVWDRLIPGGIIVYDDYGFYGCDGVRTYVEEQRHRPDRTTIYNLNGHAVVIKLR